METWQRMLLYAGGAAGVAAVLYYLLREEPEGSKTAEGEEDAEDGGRSQAKKKGLGTDAQSVEVTKEQVQEILDSIVESQEKMKAHMKAITKELLEKQLDFMQIYTRVCEVQPEDPLARRGISMMDFDQLLSKHQSDPQVRRGIERIMGAPDAPAPGEKAPDVPARRIVEVHAFMLQELEMLLQQFHTIQTKEALDPKSVTVAAQAIIGAKVEEKFGLTPEDIERAVIAHHTKLATDQEFASISMKMQATMAQLMGGSP
mmetsp:Transcript_110653/g.219962  ORF Transcript_110653/g.219962 Transcript_110653/m.219962 type:complete len:259 (+) Transcript_110653:57-833(+)